VKKLLKSVSIYGSYRKNKTGVPFFGTPCMWSWSTNVTDGQTDGRHAIANRNTALCTKVHRAVIISNYSTNHNVLNETAPYREFLLQQLYDVTVISVGIPDVIVERHPVHVW